MITPPVYRRTRTSSSVDPPGNLLCGRAASEFLTQAFVTLIGGA
jgi:hypothetical protein